MSPNSTPFATLISSNALIPRRTDMKYVRESMTNTEEKAKNIDKRRLKTTMIEDEIKIYPNTQF